MTQNQKLLLLGGLGVGGFLAYYMWKQSQNASAVALGTAASLAPTQSILPSLGPSIALQPISLTGAT